MKIFGDESGNSASGAGDGVSRFLAFALVIFAEDADAAECDERISRLRRELRLPENFEFHFRKNSWRIRLAFLKAVAVVKFRFVVTVSDKSENVDFRRGFAQNEQRYVQVLLDAFGTLAPHVASPCSVTLDEYGSIRFQYALKKRILRKLAEANAVKVTKYSARRSRQNNLLQLADYVASICNRRALGKADAEAYFTHIADKELKGRNH